MFEIVYLQENIIQIMHEGFFTFEHWSEYKKILINLLDHADDTLYILSDFSRTEHFDKRVVMQAGTAPHLTHAKLGLIVLYSGSQLNNFILQIAQNRAQRECRGGKLRIHNNYDSALETLLKHRSNSAGNATAV